MYIRQVGSNALLILALVLPLFSGCKKSTPESSANENIEAPKNGTTEASAVTEAPIIARVHWLGKKRISAETNAAYFMTIWNLPESARLEVQTLDKLATAPWRLLLHQPSTNALSPIGASPLLRPLLEDVLQQESCLEIRDRTNGVVQVAFAIRLDEPRARLWETNLADVLESLTGLKVRYNSGSDDPHHQAASRGWSLKKQDPPNLIEITRAGDWTIIGLSQGNNDLFQAFSARIQHQNSPVQQGPTNYWVDADLDLAKVAQAIGHKPKSLDSLPRFAFTIVGDGDNVRTRGNLSSAVLQTLDLSAWNIPTNAIREPLISFTACRGLATLLNRLNLPGELRIDPMPNQAYFWALAQIPFQSFAAIEVQDATNVLRHLSVSLTNWLNPYLSKNGGSIMEVPTTASLVCTGIPFATPYLAPLTNAGQSFLLAGMFPNTLRTNAVPQEILNELFSKTNLVYYDWEITGDRVLQLRYLDDLGHIVFTHSHKPRLSADSPAVLWLGSIQRRLGNSVTEISVASSDKLLVTRLSHLGFTAFELECIANYLQSSAFPLFTQEPTEELKTSPK